MKFLLAIALLIPALAQAAPNAAKIEGEDALRLWSALKSESESDTQNFSSPSLTIECKRAEALCSVSLKNQEGDKQKHLYRDEEAHALYQSLNVEEFEGRLGFTKVFAGLEGDFEILCSRFFGAEGESFSCTIGLGK